jgi:hypothetical protein
VYIDKHAPNAFESEGVDDYFRFNQIDRCACDLCDDGEKHTKDELRSVSSLTLRQTERFQARLEAVRGQL